MILCLKHESLAPTQKNTEHKRLMIPTLHFEHIQAKSELVVSLAAGDRKLSYHVPFEAGSMWPRLQPGNHQEPQTQGNLSHIKIQCIGVPQKYKDVKALLLRYL